nr:MAG TPA: hypothetical protein [Caudoviricetes sp.]
MAVRTCRYGRLFNCRQGLFLYLSALIIIK